MGHQETDAHREWRVIPLRTVTRSAVEIALDELEHIHAFLYRRVGNRADAEDLTQNVALKSLSRLEPGRSEEDIRGYLYATARTELAAFWAVKFGLPMEDLQEDIMTDDGTDVATAAPLPEQREAERRIRRILGQIPDNYALLLELRFLRGYTTREIAAELGTTKGGVRIMQLRALRAAARRGRDV